MADTNVVDLSGAYSTDDETKTPKTAVSAPSGEVDLSGHYATESQPADMGGAGGSWDEHPEETTASKAWRIANTPLIPEGRAEKEGKEYTEAPATLKETEHPYMTAAKKGLAGTYADTLETARQFTSTPLAIGTLGLGSVAEELAKVPSAAGRLAKYGSRLMGGAFGAQGAIEAGKGVEKAVEEGQLPSKENLIPISPETAKQTLGGAGQAALGTVGMMHGTAIGEEPASKVMTAPVRSAARVATKIQPILPTAIGMGVGEMAGHPYWGGIAGRIMLPQHMLDTLLEKGRTVGLNNNEANLVRLNERVQEAEKDAEPARRAYEAHRAGRERGEPAPDDVLKDYEKTQSALASARMHLKAHMDMMGEQVAPVVPDQEITPDTDAKMRTSPTNEELKARQEKLMGQIEDKAGIEKPKPTPENVKLPGQVQPETFPQEPTAKPEVPPMGARMQMPGETVREGRVPQLPGLPERYRLTEGVPEEPKGEVLPPEQPKVKPGKLSTLRAVGGKVIDTEEPLQSAIEKGLQGKPEPTAKMRPTTPEEPTLLGKIEERPETPKAEAPKTEVTKTEAPKEEYTPEYESKAEQVLSQHSDQDLIRFAKKAGIDADKYDFAARDENRHRVERDQLVKDLLSKLPEEDKTNIARLSDEFNKKDTTLWTEAERSNLSKAQRSRAIMQEHEGDPKSVSGGSQATEVEPEEEQARRLGGVSKAEEEPKVSPKQEVGQALAGQIGDKENAQYEWVRGMEKRFPGMEREELEELWNKVKPEPESKTVGTAEGAKADTDHFAQAKKELPEGTLSEQLSRAQELKEAAAKPVDMSKAADDYNKENKLHPIQPEKIVGKDKRAAEIADAFEKMEHNPNDPAVKASYDALKKDIQKQWDYATKKLGIKIEPTDGDPYGFTEGKKPAEQQLFDDVKNNKHLGVFRGGNPLQEGHPLSEVDPKTGETYNTMFRAIHDLFGHVAQGHDFSEPGEESAWNAHMQMMEPDARPAMTTETRGQTSWFFNREPVRLGEEAPGKFAEQKAGLLPDFAMERDALKPTQVFEHIKGNEKPFAILTAENPNNERLTDAENYKRNQELLEDLKEKGYKPKFVGGVNKDVEGKTEHSFFVPDITEKDAADLGSKHGQESILTKEGLHHLDTDKINPSDNKGLITGDKAKEQPYYSIVDGEPFAVPVDFDKEVPSNKAKAYKDMTPEEQEALAAKGQSGGAPEKKLPTGDDLIKKYGESSGDPMDTTFILKDGRAVANTGVDHDQMLGGKATDKNPPREAFVADGNIRVRARSGPIGSRETSLSIPESGITPGQLSYLKKMSPQLKSGAVLIEVGKPGGDYRVLEYGKATPEELGKTVRDLVRVVPEGYPKEPATVSGGAPSAATAPAKLPEVAEKFGTEEEKAGIAKSKAQTEKFVETMEKIPEVHEYTDIALAGAGARKWYQRSTKAFDSMAEEAPEYFKEEGDKDKFINLLAASSPRQSVAMNLRETLRTWKAYVDAGRPEGDALKSLLDENLTPATSKTPNAMKALTGQEMWPDITKNKNFKVPSFARNLRGWLGSVTNDGWMSLFAGLDPREISSAHSYHPLSIATRAAADELGWEPAEAQAAIWSFTQALTERGEELPEEVRKHSEDFVDLLANDPQVRDLLADLGVSHENLDTKLRAIGEKPEVSSRTSPTTSRSISRLRERIEKARGEGTIPPPKSGQGELFKEPPARESRSRIEDEETRFNPEELDRENRLKKYGTKMKR